MRLQIIVPHWKETFEEISPLLDSIALQQAIPMSSIGVIIVYDGPEATPIEYKKQYPFQIQEVRPDMKLGVSLARDLGLDIAEAEYVMFCDADDMFYHSCGIYAIYDLIKQFHFDTLTSVFIEEKKMDNNKIVFVRHANDSTFVHGKVYRRQYLLDSGIRFKPDLTVHEDSYFVTLAMECTEKRIYTQEQFYLWKWNGKSISRSDPQYILKTYGNLMDSFGSLVDALAERGKERANMYAYYIIAFSYYWLNEPHWHLEENKSYLEAAERKVARLIKKNESLWSQLDEEQRKHVEETVPKNDVSQLPPFEEWFDMMKAYNLD